MEYTDTIVVTGAAGFIGSCLVAYLNEQGYENLILVDDFSNNKKVYNLNHKKYSHKVHREQFFDWLKGHPSTVQYIFHLGARTDTTEFNYEILQKWNVDYSKAIWEYASQHHIPLLYASSAATYGDGALGYTENDALVPDLKPLNPYGISKNEFDIWVLEQKRTLPFWAGLKFFNVYGPNEYHKGRMASVIFHAYQQIKDRGYIKLFRSHNPQYQDGGQLRDFIYAKDVVKVLYWLMQQQPQSGIYNLGTGQARSFNDLAHAVLNTLQHTSSQITYIDTPEDIRDKYQYFTEANMSKLQQVGYTDAFTTLEAGIQDYLSHYLTLSKYY